MRERKVHQLRHPGDTEEPFLAGTGENEHRQGVSGLRGRTVNGFWCLGKSHWVTALRTRRNRKRGQGGVVNETGSAGVQTF